jgi:hypothetical protein
MISSLGIMMITAVVGFLVGLAYFAWLWRSVSALARAKRIPAVFILSAVLRLAALAAVVGALLWLEIAPVLFLAGGLGFFVARLVITSVLSRPASEC